MIVYTKIFTVCGRNRPLTPEIRFTVLCLKTLLELKPVIFQCINANSKLQRPQLCNAQPTVV